MNRRFDHYTALLIDTVLAAYEEAGISVSLTALLNLGLPSEVATRLAAHLQLSHTHSPISGKESSSLDSTAILARAKRQAADSRRSAGPDSGGIDKI